MKNNKLFSNGKKKTVWVSSLHFTTLDFLIFKNASDLSEIFISSLLSTHAQEYNCIYLSHIFQISNRVSNMIPGENVAKNLKSR